MPVQTNRRLTVIALLLSMFMAAMEATVVGTAMPTVIAELGGLAHYGWVGSAYILTSTVCVPLFGKLADLYGRKPVQLFGIAMFLAGSVLSGFAGNIWQLIAARALQGLGAGSMQPVGMTIIGDIFDIEARARVQGAFGAVWGSAAIAGPLLGGFFVHYLSWRWVFWINVPFGIASAALLMFAYRENRDRTKRPVVDWWGALFLSLATVALLLGASREWPEITLPLGLLLTACFLWIERRAREPVLPLDLVAQRAVAVASTSSMILGAAMLSAVMYTPLFVQGVLRRSPTEAGTAIAPMLVGWPIAATATGRLLTRIGFRKPVILGAFVCLLGVTGVAVSALHVASLRGIQASMFVFGFGMGLANTAIIVALQTGVAQNQRGVVTALSMFARSMGGAFGVGALGAVFALRIARRLPPRVVSSMLDPHQRRLAGDAGASVVSALNEALTPVFFALVGLAVANLFVVWFYPKSKPAFARGPKPESGESMPTNVDPTETKIGSRTRAAT